MLIFRDKDDSVAGAVLFTDEWKLVELDSKLKPSAVKFRKVFDIVIGARFKELGTGCAVANGNDAAGTITLCLGDGSGTVLNQEAVRNGNIQPAGGFQMHGAFVRVRAVIINNLIL